MAQPNQASGRSYVRTQPSGGPPVVSTVRVAVLPPRLPPEMHAPAGVGSGEGPGFDEHLNLIHNLKVDPNQSGSVSYQSPTSPTQTQSPEITTSPPTKAYKSTFLGMRKTPLRAREKSNDIPPFVFREVTYEVWRKHYAKDKSGRYRGTDTPAEDCLLLPEDVERWRLGPVQTRADLWTRGRDALPGYTSTDIAVEGDPSLPEYSEKALPEEGEAPSDSRVLSPVPSRLQRVDTTSSTTSTSGFVAEGRTTDQIIRDYQAKHEARKKEDTRWKKVLRTASGYNIMGPGSAITAEEAAKRRGGN